MKMYTVYGITNSEAGLVYVGMTSAFGRRSSHHKWEMKNKSPTKNLYIKIKELGGDNVIESLSKPLSYEEAATMEEGYIQERGRRIDGSGTLLNESPGRGVWGSGSRIECEKCGESTNPYAYGLWHGKNCRQWGLQGKGTLTQPADLSHSSAYLLDGCNTVFDYSIRREFYGYLNKADPNSTEELEKGDHDVDITAHYGLYLKWSLAEWDEEVYKLNIFNDIHKELDEVKPDDVSIFNLLDDDYHRP